MNISNSNIVTHGSSSPGLYVRGDNTAPTSTATAVNTRIEATGLDSSALRIGNSGTLNLSGVTAIASGARSPGLISVAAADAINILSANNSRIISVQDTALAVNGGISQINLDSSLIQGASYWLAVGSLPTPISNNTDSPGGDAEGEGGTTLLRSKLRELEANYRPEVSLYAAMPSIELNYNRTMLGTFHQRVGAEEQISGKQKSSRDYVNGTWMRFINRGGSVDNKSILNQGPKFDFRIYAAELGVDVYHNEYDNHHRDFAGFYVGYGSNSSSVTLYDQQWAGKADFKSTTIGLYWTHIGANDWYIDGVLQTNLFDHDVGSAAMQLNHVRNEGYAASLEVGYPFALGTSLSLEPEAQLIYQRLPAVTAQDLAARIRFNTSESFITRAAARFVLDQQLDKAHFKRVTTWLTPNFSYDAKGTSTTEFSSANGWVPFQSTLRGSWLGVDVGSTLQFNELVSLYGTVSGDTAVNGRGQAYNVLAGLRVNLQ